MDETRTENHLGGSKLKARRRLLLTIHLIACGFVLVGLFLLVGLADGGGESIRGIPLYPLVFVGATVVVLALTLMWFRLWRCPHCNRYIGQVFRIRMCPLCGFRLM